MKMEGTALAVSLLLFAATAGAAQPASSLEEIIVTATRTRTELAKVPESVSVVNEEDVQLGRQQLGLDESLNRIPGVFIMNRYNFTQDLRIAIRGAGSRANFGIRGIKIFIDGIPATLADGQSGVDDIDLGSIKRVEVIRGPASSLYGSSAGGVISIFTEDGPKTPFVEADATAGQYDMQKFQFKTGGQYKKLNYLVNAWHLGMLGYRQHSRVDQWLINSKFRYDIDNASDVTVILNGVDSPIAEDPGGLTASLAKTDPRSAWSSNLAYDAGEALDQERMGIVYRNQLTENSEVRLRNYYVWRHFLTFLPLGSSGVSGFNRFFYGGGAQYTYSGDLFGHTNSFTTGVDVDSQNDHRRRWDNNFGFKGPLTENQNEDAMAYGFYFREAYNLTEALQLSAGGRYDVVDLSVGDLFLANGNQSGNLNFDQFSPSVGLVWSVLPELSVYANYGTAFETPTFVELGGLSSDLTTNLGGYTNVKAQTADSYEAGLRGNLWDNRVTYNFAGYVMKVKNEITNVETLGNRGVFDTADTDRNGAEASVVVRLPMHVRWTTSYTYENFHYSKFPTHPEFVGNRMPVIPVNMAYTELAYRPETGFYATWDLHWVGRFYTNNANSTINPAYTVSNLRFGERYNLGKVAVGPFFGINNLFDEKYNENVRVNAFGGRYFEPAPRRNIYGGVTVRYNF